MHNQIFNVAVGDIVVRIENHSIAHIEHAVLGHLGAERLNHTGHLVPGEQRGVAYPMMRRGRRIVALHGYIGGQAAAARDRGQAGETWRATGMITRTGAHHSDAGTVRRHIRHGHIEAEDALPSGHARTLDRELTAQFVHLLSVTHGIDIVNLPLQKRICMRIQGRLFQVFQVAYLIVKKYSIRYVTLGATGP